MKMMKNIMALALAFTFVFVGAQSADAKMDGSYDHAGQSCNQCHGAAGIPTDGSMKAGFEEGDACTQCHVETEDGHAYSGQGVAEKPSPAHGMHNVYVDDAATEGSVYDDCVGCHVNPADAEDTNGDGSINMNDPVGPAGPEDDNAGPYVPTADTDNNPLTPQVSYLTPHMVDGQPMFGAEDCGTCHEGAKVAATPETDPDGDGLTSDIEAMLGYSDSEPNVDSDYDADGMTDLEEVNYNAKKKANLDPMNPDTDGDGLTDGWETTYGTRENGLDPEVANELITEVEVSEDTPVNVDPVTGVATGTIKDMNAESFAPIFVVDAANGEVTFEGNAWTYTPNATVSTQADVATVDTFTVQYLNANNQVAEYTVEIKAAVEIDNELPTEDPTTDYDNDGLTYEQEKAAGTNPYAADTDGDGFFDGIEIAAGTNPVLASSVPADTDGDKTLDYLDTDDDNDGFSDADEVKAGTDPLDKTDYPATFGPGNGSGGGSESGSESGSGESNPETGSGSLMLAFGAVTAASAGLVAIRRK